MTSWIAVIDSKYPQHWDIAKNHGFWDMTSAQKVALGDTVYFWQGGKSLIAQCTATSSYFPITAAHHQPWVDAGERKYTTRFELDVLSEAPNDQPSWGTLQKQWGASYPPQFRAFNDRESEAVLARYFDTTPISTPYSDEERERELERLGFDLRTYAWRSIAQRQGQKEFRAQLMTAYGNRCAVTGTASEYVLEAAHIARYLGAHTNRTNNGLLLRADIHTLFDLHRLTITPQYVVRVDSKVGPPYVDLDGASIHLPTNASEHPLPPTLLEHNEECDWL